MTGSEAKAAFDQAKSLVLEGRLAEAQDVHLLPSDRKIIDRMIGRMVADRAAAGEIEDTGA